MKFLLSLIAIFVLFSQEAKYYDNSAFKQIDDLLPTPNTYRDASGVPGSDYWKQKVDYKMKVEIDEDKQTLKGSLEMTYQNNSPQALSYIWLQLDQNLMRKDANGRKIQSATNFAANNSKMPLNAFDRHEYLADFDGGFKFSKVTDASDKDLKYTIGQYNVTMMRVDLKSPVAAKGGKTVIKLEWSFNIGDATKEGRGGYEYFPEDKNYIFEMAQFFPRACVYDDTKAWQHKEFLGRGEFALEFGDYDVEITVPADHIVGATGVLQNSGDVLTSTQLSRYKKQGDNTEVEFIVTPDEAKEAEKSKSNKKKTWKYSADNVRDFAFASSRKFVWDGAALTIAGNKIRAMSLYPKEGMPLWDKYSTHAVIITLQVYSKYSVEYPYPTAYSVHGAVGGMEYPMLCFNGGRPEKDGTYSEDRKWGQIGVIIHEVGHNFFPMIVSSDERQWTWMDEGLNTFLQYLTEREWSLKFKSRRGPADFIVDYMKNPDTPIMTNSEAIAQFGANAYSKPATGLNILRETILGRELFDYAFKRYSNQWKFKHPNPADFFRIMEDASGVDLDWFWRGWFFTTKYVSQSIDKVEKFTIDNGNPENNTKKMQDRDSKELHITDARNNIIDGGYEGRHKLGDFYATYDPLKFTEEEIKNYKEYVEKLSPKERELLNSKRNYYRVTLSNTDDRSMVMPVLLTVTFKDGSKEDLRLPAEVWQLNEKTFVKEIISEKEIARIEIDAKHEIPDIDRYDNVFPRDISNNEFGLFKQEANIKNPMKDAQTKKKKE